MTTWKRNIMMKHERQKTRMLNTAFFFDSRYPYFFMYASLTTVESDQDLHVVNDAKATAGSVVQSLHKLKDIDQHGTGKRRKEEGRIATVSSIKKRGDC